MHHCFSYLYGKEIRGPLNISDLLGLSTNLINKLVFKTLNPNPPMVYKFIVGPGTQNFVWFLAWKFVSRDIRDIVPIFYETLIHARCRGKHRCCIV